MQYAKVLAQIAVTVLSAAVVLLTGDASWSGADTINVILAGVTAIGVFYVPNAPNAPVAKAVVSALSAVLTLASVMVVGGFDLTEVLQLALAGLGALGVYGVRNNPPSAV